MKKAPHPKDAERKARIVKMNRALRKLFPVSRIELNYSTPWELLVAVILSAQCTDKRVNLVTKDLFAKYPTIKEYADADITELERIIHSCGFYHAKAKNIIGAAGAILARFDGTLPKTIADFVTVPGVARKTANVVLANVYGIHEGIAVDTHIRRFAIRFDLSDYQDPVRIELDLMRVVPKKDWWDFHHRLVLYGRYLCPALPHDCAAHPLTKFYPEAATRWPKAK